MSILQRLFFNICLMFRQFLPKQPCLLCGAWSSNEAWCAACDAALPYLNAAHCPVCALPTLNGAVCGKCLSHPPHYTRTVAVYAYAYPLNKLVLDLKHGEKLPLADSLGKRLAQSVLVRPDCIIAMPLHPTRLRERGFNQSQQLAQVVGKCMKIPVLPLACQRIINTPSQATLPFSKRKKNVRQAFICKAALAGKHVAVVDDVMTTGATLDALALTLLHAGATEVSAWVVARTLPHTD